MNSVNKRTREIIKKVFYPIYVVYRYFTHDLKKKKENRNFLKNGLSVLVDFDQCMTENGHKYSLAYGTLLGAVREKGFIPHDDDIDTWMWVDDYSPKLIEDLEKAGFKLKFSFTVDNDVIGKQDTFIYKGVLVDIFYLYRDTNGEGCNIVFTNQPDCSNRKESVKKHGGLLPFKITIPVSQNFIRTEFHGYQMPIPDNYDEVLTRRYGEDYMIPQPKWGKDRIDKNHQYLYDKLGAYVEYEV